MADYSPKPRMHVVPGLRRAEVSPADFQSSTEGSQATLFPEPRAGTVIFVSFPDVNETEFIDVLTAAKPALVIELRYSPRFDIGRLSRKSVFQFFEREQSRYVDLTSSRMADRDASSLLNDVRALLEKESIALDRPVAFLISSHLAQADFQDLIIEAVSSTSKAKTEVFRVPRYVPA